MAIFVDDKSTPNEQRKEQGYSHGSRVRIHTSYYSCSLVEGPSSVPPKLTICLHEQNRDTDWKRMGGRKRHHELSIITIGLFDSSSASVLCTYSSYCE